MYGQKHFKTAPSVIFLIDNSQSSIDGDFYPNRLQAQGLGVERLMNYYFRTNADTQVALGTLAEDEFGIIESLTKVGKPQKVSDKLPFIKRGGPIHLKDGIKCAFLALKQANPKNYKKIIAFVGSEHTFTADDALQLANYANYNQIQINIVTFGENVNDEENLQLLVEQIEPIENVPNATFLHIASDSSLIFADRLLASPLGPGSNIGRGIEDVNPNEDPELSNVLKLSLQQQTYDDELANAIMESMDLLQTVSPEILQALKEEWDLTDEQLKNPDIMNPLIMEKLQKIKDQEEQSGK